MLYIYIYPINSYHILLFDTAYNPPTLWFRFGARDVPATVASADLPVGYPAASHTTPTS